MNTLKKDLTSLLNFFVERESDEEKKFIEDQKRCELKLCISVSYSNCGLNNERSDLLMIHTKLNQSNELPDDITSQNQDLFYIKSQTVSHCTGLLSPSNHGNCKIMSIETVVTKEHSKCETVFKTFVNKSDNGKRQKTQRSFTREIATYQHSKEENCKHNRFSVIFSDEDDENANVDPNIISSNSNSKTDSFVKPKLKKKSSFKKLKFNWNPKSIEKQRSITKESIPVINDIKNEAEQLQPIKKPKSNINISKLFKNIFQKNQPAVVDNKIPSSKNNLERKRSSYMRNFSTEDCEMEKEKPTNILARISVKKGTKLFEIIKDDVPFIDDEEDIDDDDISVNKSISNFVSESFFHFDFSVSDEIDATINLIIEKMTCACEKRLSDLFSDILRLISSTMRDKALMEKKTSELKLFDKTLRHFEDCDVWICKKKYIKYRRHMRQSQESFQNADLCTFCKDIDDHFHDNLSSIFVPFLQQLEKKDKKELCSCERKKKEKIKTYLLSTITRMKANGDFRKTFNKTTRHFKDCLSPWISPSLNLLSDEENENATCNCDNRRIKIYANFVSSIIYKQNFNNNEEISALNFETQHFKSCSKNLSTSDTFNNTPSPYSPNSPVFNSFSSPNFSNSNINISPNRVRKRSRKNSNVSMDSIKYLDEVFQNLKIGNEIGCPIETINYFINSKDYNHYEKGLLRVLDPNVTIENMRLFFYLTRIIVKQIDDPHCENNENIRQIISFSENFLIKHYYNEIEKQGGLDKFILDIDSLD